MSALAMSELLDWLKFKADVQSTEAESGLTDDRLRSLLKVVIPKHNSAYSATDSTTTVPAKELDCVVILAWAELCLVRASVFSKDNNTSANGFSSEFGTPFNKCLALSKYLIETAYPAALVAAGVSSSVSGPQVSEISVRNNLTEARTDPRVAKAPPQISISNATPVNSTTVVTFTYPNFGNFSSLKLFSLTGSESISAPWNFNGTVHPGVNDSASLVMESNDINRRSVKVTGLPAGPATVRLIAVLTNMDGLHSYSDELVITIT